MVSIRMIPSDVLTAHAEYSVCPDEIKVVKNFHRLGMPR